MEDNILQDALLAPITFLNPTDTKFLYSTVSSTSIFATFFIASTISGTTEEWWEIVLTEKSKKNWMRSSEFHKRELCSCSLKGELYSSYRHLKRKPMPQATPSIRKQIQTSNFTARLVLGHALQWQNTSLLLNGCSCPRDIHIWIQDAPLLLEAQLCIFQRELYFVRSGSQAIP